MFERFTRKARAAIAAAETESRRLGHDYIGTEHQLLGLLVIGEGVAHAALERAGVSWSAVDAAVRKRIPPQVDCGALAALGIDLEAVRNAVDDTFGSGALDRSLRTKQRRGDRSFRPDAKNVMELSLREALTLGHNYIGTEHLLLALVRASDATAAAILRDLAPGLDLRGLVLDELSART